MIIAGSTPMARLEPRCLRGEGPSRDCSEPPPNSRNDIRRQTSVTPRRNATALSGSRRCPAPLLLLSGAVGLILLIGCANVANMLTSLAVVRRQEIAIRSALGAGGGRLARQFLCESILLAVMRQSCGRLLVAYGATAACRRAAFLHLPSRMAPRFDEIAIDRSVLLFSLAISLLAGVAFGYFPPWPHIVPIPNELLKENNRTTAPALDTCASAVCL